MYEILYLPLAGADLEDIISYISDHLGTPNAAVKLLDELEQSVSSLQEFPYSHPRYRTMKPLTEEYRILTVNNYAVFFVVREPQKKVEIYRVIYARRDLTTLLT
jgi:toxin ParE1/3/4